MIGATLDELVDQLRAETKMSTHSSRGLENREYLTQIIQRTYEVLWDDYDWEHLQVKREDATVAMAAGQRYYDYPDNMAMTGINEVWHKVGNAWMRLEYGIDYSHYSQFDPEQNVRADPVLRWQVRDNDQFEVWPLPQSNTTIIAFDGKKKFVPLVNPTDRAQIDTLCIVLSAAAEILMGMNSKEAETKGKLASSRILKMKARTSKKRTIMGSGDPHSNRNQQFPRVRAVYAR